MKKSRSLKVVIGFVNQNFPLELELNSGGSRPDSSDIICRIKRQKGSGHLCGSRRKTVQLADLMQNTGSMIALDIKKQRLMALSDQLERCRVKNTIVYCLDARRASRLRIGFDRILLDVPCSGNFVTDEIGLTGGQLKIWRKTRNFKGKY